VVNVCSVSDRANTSSNIFAFQDISTNLVIMGPHMLPGLRNKHNYLCPHFIRRHVLSSVGS